MYSAGDVCAQVGLVSPGGLQYGRHFSGVVAPPSGGLQKSPDWQSPSAVHGWQGPNPVLVVHCPPEQTSGGVQCWSPVHSTHVPAAPQCRNPGVVQFASDLHATQAPDAPQNGRAGCAAAHSVSLLQFPHMSKVQIPPPAQSAEALHSMHLPVSRSQVSLPNGLIRLQSLSEWQAS